MAPNDWSRRQVLLYQTAGPAPWVVVLPMAEKRKPARCAESAFNSFAGAFPGRQVIALRRTSREVMK